MYQVAMEKFSHTLEEDFQDMPDLRHTLKDILPADYYQDHVFYNSFDVMGKYAMRYLSNDQYIDDFIEQLDSGIIIQLDINGQYYTFGKGAK